jgi:hypothetical protein
MTNRIDFPPESLDHILFERELFEKGIKYVKSDGIVYKLSQTVSFLFEEKDYTEAIKIAEAFPTTIFRKEEPWLGRRSSTRWNESGNSSIQKVFFLVVLFVICLAAIFIKLFG